MFLDGSEKSLNELLKELEDFANLSGLKINFEKTQFVWIGSKKFNTSSIKTKWKLLWGKQTFKLLGINFNTDLAKMMEQNCTSKLRAQENMVKGWEKNKPDTIGKITAIKVLFIPAFNHLCITLASPDQDITNHINSILFNFLWSINVKFKRNVVIKQYWEGGSK